MKPLILDVNTQLKDFDSNVVMVNNEPLTVRKVLVSSLLQFSGVAEPKVKLSFYSLAKQISKNEAIELTEELANNFITIVASSNLPLVSGSFAEIITELFAVKEPVLDTAYNTSVESQVSDS